MNKQTSVCNNDDSVNFLNPNFVFLNLSNALCQKIRLDLPTLATFSPNTWIRSDVCLIGFGNAFNSHTYGSERFTAAWNNLQSWASNLEVWDLTNVRTPMPIPLAQAKKYITALGAFSFAPYSSTPSLLQVPELGIVHLNQEKWAFMQVAPDTFQKMVSCLETCCNLRITLLEKLQTLQSQAFQESQIAHIHQSSQTEGNKPSDLTTQNELDSSTNHPKRIPDVLPWAKVVAQGIKYLNDPQINLQKIVLSRQISLKNTSSNWDFRKALDFLQKNYPTCWTYRIGNFVGATPELLVGLSNGIVNCHVLAGSAAPTQSAAAQLQQSKKDLTEHEFALQSVVSAIEPLCENLKYPSTPDIQMLPNVCHLASDVTARTNHNVLELAAALHPTAAVGGTPHALALKLIEQLEPADRGLYAGPIGWLNLAGEGQWGIALRSAELTPDGNGRAFAGGGILANSDPHSEVVETENKLRPILEALGIY